MKIPEDNSIRCAWCNNIHVDKVGDFCSDECKQSEIERIELKLAKLRHKLKKLLLGTTNGNDHLSLQ
jgi:hypothetical protein